MDLANEPSSREASAVARLPSPIPASGWGERQSAPWFRPLSSRQGYGDTETPMNAARLYRLRPAQDHGQMVQWILASNPF